MLELSPAITRQYIDAVAVFDALDEATAEAAQVRGGMYWHAGPAASPESKYLVRTTPAGAETSLGARTPETQAIYDKFTQRKRDSTERMAGLRAALDQQQRMNRVSDWAWHIDLMLPFADHRGHGELGVEDLRRGGGGGPIGPLDTHNLRCCHQLRKIDGFVDQARWPGLILSRRSSIDEAATPQSDCSTGSAAG